MTAIIELDRVSIAFQKEVIYDQLSFSVNDGEFLCILGPSGCGKSTLLRVIGDLLGVDTGSVTVAGFPAAQAWQEIAYVFQSPRLLPWRDAEANVILGQQLRFGRERGADEMRQKARALLDLVGLGRDTHKYPAMMSGGERQRVSIARALAVDPRIVLMDEPFSALDVTTRRRMRSEIIEIWKKTGKTIVFVTHEVDEALELADRVVVLSVKPTRVLETVSLSMPRPRNLASPEMNAARMRLTRLLGVPEQAEE
ncbi:ABC transporter ATP-binding protein [Methylocella sp. CPCC 101449]|uniref:ABC transporter ATP-binding protein n=1 Tax=Methylocella sp. CPCC 101449 TaxID=2987531 RepID=UPI00288CE204|nr:ABC transporter ATP-binding protein [Methylocella sp. CPCC 101449]MDT2021284.1 ABC transporter ATP-binding protein [Methylocella sp. CPCC 101449]